MARLALLVLGLTGLASAPNVSAQEDGAPVLTGLKAEAVEGVDGRGKLVQEIVEALQRTAEGAVAGAKAVAATLLDLLQDPALVESAWEYFREEQTATESYQPFIDENDAPAIEKNTDIMAQFRDRLEGYYYDPSRFDNYLERLGVRYPELEAPGGE